MQLFDRLELDDAANVRKTADGYLVASPRVARTGIQIYSGKECGRDDMERVRVYRPADQVFHKASMQSYAYRPITNNHPPENVTADNWLKYTKGQIGGEIARDGSFVVVPMVLMDAAAIRDVEAGKRELSLGYTCDLRWEDGETEDGEKYDAVQVDIRANHLAVVKAARGGRKLRIGDGACPECGHDMGDAKKCPECGYKIKAEDAESLGDDKGELEMKTIVIDGLNCEVEDKSAQFIQRHVDTLAKLVKDAKEETEAERKKREEEEKRREKFEKDHATLDATSKTEIATRDAKIATLEKQITDAQPTPQQIDKMVIDRAAVVTKAKTVIGDKLVIDGKTDAEIRRQVVDAKLGDLAKGWTDDQVAASFGTLTATAGTTGTTVLDMARTFSQPVVNDAREKAYQDRDRDLESAYRTTAAA